MVVEAARKPDCAPAAEREAPGAEASANALETVRVEGEAALREDRFDDAIRAFGEAVALAPADGRARLQLGVALQGAGRHADAAASLGEAQKALPDDAAPFLHAAVSLLALGDVKAALVAASEACHRAPELPAAHYAYGQAFLALGEPERAARAFAAAVRFAPQWADAYVNFGVARYRMGAIEDAKQAMQLALRADPNSQAAATNLGAFMRISGEAEGAERLLDGRLERAPDAAGVRLNIVADLLQEERAGEALALLQQASPPAADLAAARHWRLQEALALLQLRRPAEARAAIEAFEALGPIPSALEPLLLWRKTLLAALEGDGRRANATALGMEEALARMGPDAVAEHAIMAHYDLAKYWSGQNQHPRAFAHWTAGHKALSRFQPFSREAHRAFVDASIQAFSKARLNGGRGR